jgi:uncharacterized protein with beta-barrel porin domain
LRNDVTRGIVLPGASRTATSSHGGNDVALDIGVSRPMPVDEWQITPRVGLSYFHIDQASFTESGAGSLNLAVNPAVLNALYSRVGVTVAHPMMLGDTSILPEIRAAWLHNFLDTQGQFAASFLGTGTASFGQVGTAIGRDAGDLGVGVSFAISQTTLPGQMSGFIQYDATLAAHETANAIAAGLRLKLVTRTTWEQNEGAAKAAPPPRLHEADHSTTRVGSRAIGRETLWKLGEVFITASWICANSSGVPLPLMRTT